MPEVEITRGCNSKALSFHLSTYPLPLFPRFWRREESQAALPLSSQGGHRDGAEGGAGSVSAICPSSCPGGSGLPRSPWQGGLCSARAFPRRSRLSPPRPAARSRSLTALVTLICLSIDVQAPLAALPPLLPALSSGTGRADRSIVSAGCRQTGELKLSALAPCIGWLFSSDGEQYQGKFHPKNYWQASCKQLPVAQTSRRQ